MQLYHAPESDFIFLPQYEKHTQEKGWRTRTDEEIEVLIKNHHLLIHQGEILAGCSISPFHEITFGQKNFNGRLIECLWRKYPAQRHGLMVVDESKKLYPHTLLFAFSKNGIFQKAGFQNIPDITSSTGAKLYALIP